MPVTDDQLISSANLAAALSTGGGFLPDRGQAGERR